MLQGIHEIHSKHAYLMDIKRDNIMVENSKVPSSGFIDILSSRERQIFQVKFIDYGFVYFGKTIKKTEFNIFGTNKSPLAVMIEFDENKHLATEEESNLSNLKT